MFAFSWLLIQNKILRNSFKENRKVFFLRDVWHSLILFAGLGLLYIFLNVMFRFIGSKGLPPFDFAFVFLSFSLLVFLPLVFYSAVVCGISFLFQKEEIHFYFSMPVTTLSVFSVKLLQTYFHTVWMTFLGFFTFLIALQSYFKTTPLVYITASTAFLILLLIPVCLAVIVVIVVSRFVPFVRERGILTVIGLVVGSVLIAALRVMQPEQLATAEGKMRLVTFIQNLHRPWMTLFPSEWLTNIIFAQVQGDLGGITANISGLLILAAICLALTYFVAAAFYKKSWADAAVISGLENKKSGWQALLYLFPRPIRIFIQKDLLTFYRDTIEKGSLLILIPLVFVYLYSVYLLNRQIQKVTSELLFSVLFIYLFNFFYSSIVIAGLSGRWVLPSVSVEGNNFKLIKGSATSLADFIKAKFFLGFVPLFLLGQLLILSSSFILRMQLSLILVSVVTMAVLCWGITVICLILGMRQADFSISAPLDFALSIKGFLCMVWESIFVGIVVVLVGLPTAIYLHKGVSPYFIIFSAISVFAIIIILSLLFRVYKSSIVSLAKREI